LIIDKIEPDGYGYIQPKIPSVVIEKGDNVFESISNRYKIKNKIYYIKTKSMVLDDGSKIVYPEIYEFDISSFKNNKIYPLNIDSLINDSMFKLIENDYVYIGIKSPKLTYSSSSDMFALSYLLKDQNYMSDIFTCKFYISSDVNIISTEFNNSNISRYTNIMSSLSNLTPYLSGYMPTFESNTIII